MLTLYRVSPIILIAHPPTARSGVWPRGGGQHSGRNGDGGADDKREKGELERGGIVLEDNAAHRRLAIGLCGFDFSVKVDHVFWFGLGTARDAVTSDLLRQ